MPSSSIPNKRNTSRTKKVTPVEVKNEAEGGTTTYEHGGVSLKATKKVHPDRKEPSQARAKTPSKIDYSEKSEAELRRELTRRAKNANKAELTEILESVERILAEKTAKLLSMHTTSSKIDAINTQAAPSQSEHKDDDKPKQDMITYEDLTLKQLKKMASERGLKVENQRARKPFVSALKAADDENKENIPPGTDEALKQEAYMGERPDGRTKRLEKTTAQPLVRTMSPIPNPEAQSALSQPQYHCKKCQVPSASEELHRVPETRDPYYAYLRYEDDTSNKFYRLQVTKSGTEDLYYVRTHWGRHKTSNPSCGSYDFKSPDNAIAKFGKVFREKTSLDWVDRGMDPKKKKYSYIKPEDGSSLQDAEDGNVGSSDGSESQRTDLVDDNLSQTDTSRKSVKVPSGGSNSDRGVTPTPTKSRTRARTRAPTPRRKS
ncbi:hypothetical protein KCU98_g7038, partial [Aureobasidium melanogenum]